MRADEGKSVLREIRSIRQIEGEPHRRWFADPKMDLTIWIKDEEILGFQLTYDKPQAEKAVTWNAGTMQLRHTGVDNGEGRAGKFKGTPVLVADGNLNAWNVCGKFLRRSASLHTDLRYLVCRVLVAQGAIGGS